jgi:CheY-like chemotaxis protein
VLELLGNTVLAASAPGEIFRLARDHHGELSLLMTEVVMPKMNGRDLARVL